MLAATGHPIDEVALEEHSAPRGENCLDRIGQRGRLPSPDSVSSSTSAPTELEGLGDELRLSAREVTLEGLREAVGMGNDLAKADAVNTALANERGGAANDASRAGRCLPLPRPRGLLGGVHVDSVSRRDDDRHRSLTSAR